VENIVLLCFLVWNIINIFIINGVKHITIDPVPLISSLSRHSPLLGDSLIGLRYKMSDKKYIGVYIIHNHESKKIKSQLVIAWVEKVFHEHNPK